MPFDRKPLSQLIDDLRADLLGELAADDPLRRSDAEAYARAFAGGVHGLLGYIQYLSRQISPATADAEFLEALHAPTWGIPRKLPAAASGAVTFSTIVGSAIPSGTVIKALDGQQYTTVTDVFAVATSTLVSVVASVVGAAGNRLSGQPLSLISPLPGVQLNTVSGEISGGADIEDVESWRARILYRIQYPPQGGAAHDYEVWAKEVAGVTRAWVSPLEMGLGTVTVRFVRDDDASPFPDAGEVAAVQAYIEARRPVTSHVYVVAPVPLSVNMTIALTPNTLAIQSAVTEAIQDFLRREAAPGTTIYLSRLREAISSAAGEFKHNLTVPGGDITTATNQIAQLGTVTWA